MKAANENLGAPLARIAGQLTIYCAAVFFLTNSPAVGAEEAQNEETRVAVEKLLETLKVKETLDPALAGVKKMQEAMIEQQPLSADEKKAAREIMAVSMQEVEKMLSWESMRDLMVRVYSKVFTAQEVNSLVELFESPAGQMYVSKQKELQQATMQEMQKIMVGLIPRIREKTREAVEKVKAQQ